MLGRFKIRGKKFTVVDASEFKEAEHPRDKTGKFTSGGGHGKQISNGITAPKAGSQSHNIWTMAAHLHEQGKPVNAKAVMELGAKNGHEFTPATVGVQLGHFKKFVAESSGENPTAKKEKKSLPNTVETFEALASEKGYKKEGTFSGKTYYKNDAGNKVSYDPANNTWADIQNGNLVNKGEGMNSLSEYLGVDSATVTSKKPKAPPEDPHSVKSAATYASRKVTPSSFKFSTKGAPDESALPLAVQKSIQAYRGSRYVEINNAMRFNADFEEVSPDTMRHVLHLQRAFQMAPPTTQDIEVGRKIGLPALKAMCKHAGLSSLKELQPGNIIQEEGICSTSHKEGVWSGEVGMRIKVPKGKKAIDLSETINKPEAELMLPPNSALRVLSVKQDHNGFKFHIECEVV